MSCLLLIISAYASGLSESYVATDAAQPSEEHIRLVFVGDSGYVPDDETCTWEDGELVEGCHISVEQLAQLREAIRGVEAHAVYGLGTWSPPMPAPARPHGAGRCRSWRPPSVPSTRGSEPPATWCWATTTWGTWAAATDGCAACRPSPTRSRTSSCPLPSTASTTGWSLSSCPNTNLRDQDKWAGDALQEAVAFGDWVIVAAHHELRTAFQKLSEGPWEPPAPASG